jgi:prepilin-type N-terminal cleavage/methylation domain-containing protein
MKIIKKNEGLTLIEIVVSLAILGIIVTPLATLFVSGVKNNVNAEDRLIANQLAQKYMEESMNNISNIIDEPTKTYEEKPFKIIRTISEYKDENDKSYKNNVGSIKDDSEFDRIIKASQHMDGHTITIENKTKSTNIKIECDEPMEKTFKVSNKSKKRVNIYKVYSESKNNKVSIDVTDGEVYIYSNIYDGSESIELNQNRVCKIKITVTKGSNSNALAELVTFETIK